MTSQPNDTKCYECEHLSYSGDERYCDLFKSKLEYDSFLQDCPQRCEECLDAYPDGQVPSLVER